MTGEWTIEKDLQRKRAREWLVAEINVEWDPDTIIASTNLNWPGVFTDQEIRAGIAYIRSFQDRQPKICKECGQRVVMGPNV